MVMVSERLEKKGSMNQCHWAMHLQIGPDVGQVKVDKILN